VGWEGAARLADPENGPAFMRRKSLILWDPTSSNWSFSFVTDRLRTDRDWVCKDRTVVAHESALDVDELLLTHGNRMTRVAISREGPLPWRPPDLGGLWFRS
jgi:hypothetical protein